MKNPRRPLGINLPELLGGISLVVFGGFVVLEAVTYNLGNLRQMGPGFFPLVIGMLMMGLGAAVVVEGRITRETPQVTRLRPAVAIVVSLLAFAALVERFGLVPAAFALVFISSLAQPGVQLLPTLLLAVGVAVMGVMIFLQGFGVPLPMVRW